MAGSWVRIPYKAFFFFEQIVSFYKMKLTGETISSLSSCYMPSHACNAFFLLGAI